MHKLGFIIGYGLKGDHWRYVIDQSGDANSRYRNSQVAVGYCWLLMRAATQLAYGFGLLLAQLRLASPIVAVFPFLTPCSLFESVLLRFDHVGTKAPERCPGLAARPAG
jgi:hypothetical protein